MSTTLGNPSQTLSWNMKLISHATIHRILMVGLQAERRISAAVEEVSQVLTAEINHLFDLGLFSLPAAVAAAPMGQRKARQPKTGV